MRVFLTGGSGFVGQRLIRQLRSEGHTVVALARSTSSAQKVTDAGAQPVRGDLAELTERDDSAASPAWLESLHDVDAVVHAAARMEFWGDDAGFRADNHDPAVALHAAAVAAKVPRFVLISAAGVSTGSQRAVVVDENTDNGKPVIAYCRVKLAAEHALRAAASQGTTLVILRPPLVWGAGMNIAETAADTAKGRFTWIDGVTEYAPSMADAHQATFSQPAGPVFSPPAEKPPPEPAEPMTDLGREIATRFKEIFNANDNRRSADNRSAQVTMEPSEMGTPCDRRLALSLMRTPPVNPDSDGWAAFVGTGIHAGLAGMHVWASGSTGRLASETPLPFPSALVPKGTGDLLDRTMKLFVDFKAMGRWSRNKLPTGGSCATYRAQVHVYAKVARDRGEVVDHVAIIGLPRDEASLDDLYVWTELYNPKIALEAFARVEAINVKVEADVAELRDIYSADRESSRGLDLEIKARVAAGFDVADDCRFCPFHLPNARDITRGCNGKR
ncbi:NAD-dependent epimerase/dehydratase family protein [Streptomyces sp. NPDC056663]|uniref:NAD-dependent epimerase/dehydratase family protein n=1 Tax=Streptomyces sp. NPDC056663 TaxID=3345899 RepID=UPI0036AEA3AB